MKKSSQCASRGDEVFWRDFARSWVTNSGVYTDGTGNGETCEARPKGDF